MVALAYPPAGGTVRVSSAPTYWVVERHCSTPKDWKIESVVRPSPSYVSTVCAGILLSGLTPPLGRKSVPLGEPWSL